MIVKIVEWMAWSWVYLLRNGFNIWSRNDRQWFSTLEIMQKITFAILSPIEVVLTFPFKVIMIIITLSHPRGREIISNEFDKD